MTHAGRYTNSMAVNLVAINVGNTRSQVASVVEGELGEVHRVVHGNRDDRRAQLKAAADSLSDAPDAPVLLASVNDAAAQEVLADAHDVMNREVLVIERDVNAPIGRRLDPETLVGVDRLLNAAAAFDAVRQACVVIDAGTAVTVDFIDGEGTFHGGAILPGAAMMMRSMHEHTAALPDVTFARPDETIGHSTAQAMLAGVYHGLRGAVRELTEKYAEQYGAYPRVIATGGDARTLFEGYELIETIVDDLTLRGILVTRRHQVQAMEQ